MQLLEIRRLLLLKIRLFLTSCVALNSVFWIASLWILASFSNPLNRIVIPAFLHLPLNIEEYPVLMDDNIILQESISLMKLDAVNHTRFALVIPFTHWQFELVLRNLEDIWSNKFPCKQHENGYLFSGNIDLIFYFNQNILDHPSFLKEVKVLMARRIYPHSHKKIHSSLSSCFSSIKFMNAKLTPENDVYPLGPSVMFFNLVKSNTMQRYYKYIYYMEPDNLPCRPFWLDKLYVEAFTSSSFWMRGSMIRDRVLEKGLSSYSDHINGNALYNIGSDKFLAFLLRVERIFISQHEKYFSSYDIALFLLRNDREFYGFDEYSDTMHYWQYTNTIQNWYRTSVNLTELCNMSKSTWLVHGRNVLV